MKKILVVFGTRPEAIKLAPLIIKGKADSRFEFLVCSTGQHREMLNPILSFFNIVPDFDLNIMKPGQTLTEVTAAVLNGVDSILKQNKIDTIVVQGDTSTGFAASLAAFYNKVQIAHVEAGLRSGDMHSPFPEEFNRRAISLYTNLHLAPTETSKKHLLQENISKENIFVTGNTGIDALFKVRNSFENNTALKHKLEKQFSFLNNKKHLILVTLHRRESFGAPMKEVLQGLLELSKRNDIEILIPAHLNPMVRDSISKVLGSSAAWVNSNLPSKSNIWLCEPVDYVPFVYLMSRAHLIITDSGGIQEEAPAFGKPVLVARENTERLEAIEAGTSMLIPLQTKSFLEAVHRILDTPSEYQKMAKAQNPFGDGESSQRILDILHKKQ